MNTRLTIQLLYITERLIKIDKLCKSPISIWFVEILYCKNKKGKADLLLSNIFTCLRYILIDPLGHSLGKNDFNTTSFNFDLMVRYYYSFSIKGIYQAKRIEVLKFKGYQLLHQ